MRWTLTFLCFAVLLTPAALPAEDGPPETGEEQSFQELTIDEFGSLEQAGQVEYLCRAVLRFREKTRNISATTKYNVANVPCDPQTGKILQQVDLLKTGSVRHYDMRRIGDSYRIWEHRDPPTTDPDKLRLEIVQAYDSEKRIIRQLQSQPSLTQPTVHTAYVFPADGTKHLMSEMYFFYQYLGDEDEEENNWWDLGSDFMKHSEEVLFVKVDQKTKTVKVTFPTSWPWNDKSKVVAIQTFDLSKGCLPVERLATEHVLPGEKPPVRQRIINPVGGGGRGGRVIEQAPEPVLPGEKLPVKHRSHTVMSEPVEVDGTWIPTRFRLEVWVPRRPQLVSLYQATVSNIELGKLKPVDLQLSFPEGTEVNDSIDGTVYRIGENGSKIPIANLPKPATSGVVP